MKNSFFLKMMKFALGISVFGVEGDGSAGGGASTEAKPDGEAKPDIKPDVKPVDDAKPTVSDTEAKLLKELMDKKSSLNDTKTQLELVKAQLSQFDGVNLDEVKALIKERQDNENKQLEAKGEWDRLKGNLVEQHTLEKTALEERIKTLQSELVAKDGSINGLTIGSAFGASRFISDEMTLTASKAQIIYGSHFEYQDGKIVGFDKPAGSAQRTQLIGSDGEALAFDKAMAKIIEADADKDHLIRSKQKPGAKSGTTDSVATQMKVETKGMSRIAGALSEAK